MKVILDNSFVRVYIKHEQKMFKHSELYMRGVTTAKVYDGLDNEIGAGASYCLQGDNFQKHEGLKRALKRALLQSGLGKIDRTKIWIRVLGQDLKAKQKSKVAS